MGQPNMGDRVRITASTPEGEVTHEGILLMASKSEHVTIKLDNGYNVTFSNNNVSQLEIIEGKSNSVEKKETILEEDSGLPLIWIIHTGGTIASKVDYTTGAVAASFEPKELLNAVPELAQHARIRTTKIGNMWSDDIRARHWNLMISATKDAFESGATGVVITHGTDTMHYSAAAAAYSWAGSGQRPPGRIVFTGSQRSSDRGSTDGTENLIAAVYWAAYGPEVTGENGDASVIVMHAGSNDGVCSVIPGCNARKFHSSRRDTFQAINAQPMASIAVDRNGGCEILGDFQVPTREIGRLPCLFDENTKIMQLIAGPHLFADQINLAQNFDAILFHGTGLGHLPIENSNGDSPENDEVKKAVSEYCKEGGIAVMATQCINGPVHMDVYSKGRIQQELGIIGNHSTTGPDSALVKLHFLLSNNIDVRQGWVANLCGENQPKISN
ncbi:MAG: Glu-tRNA(Gln) amidotransferase subunit GatD [Candidatus Thermoplasmatota archaeon]|nr:Glu-tRNA(Gln) amidotransferase subunit GatD [Candidatus Thermoplasmatota archaeon]